MIPATGQKMAHHDRKPDGELLAEMPAAILVFVSRISLRAAFALGRESPFAAQQVFMNRITEIEAFDASLAALRNMLAAAEISPVIDRSLPRTNVLVYYGVGGIGKTTLSQKLEQRFIASRGKDEPARAAIRLDFAESTAFDMESYVLRLRAGLGHLARSWPVFDIAFSVYWQRAHPGEPLDEFINRDSVLRRAAHAIGLSEQISTTIVDAPGRRFLASPRRPIRWAGCCTAKLRRRLSGTAP